MHRTRGQRLRRRAHAWVGSKQRTDLGMFEKCNIANMLLPHHATADQTVLTHIEHLSCYFSLETYETQPVSNHVSDISADLPV